MSNGREMTLTRLAIIECIDSVDRSRYFIFLETLPYVDFVEFAY